MYEQVEKPKENKSRAVANGVTQMQSRGEPTFQFVDNRPEAIKGRKLQEVANNKKQVKQLKDFQDKENNNSKQTIQRIPIDDFNQAVALRSQVGRPSPRDQFLWKSKFMGYFLDEYEKYEKIGAFDSTEVGRDEIGGTVYAKMYKNWTDYVTDDAFTLSMLQTYFSDFEGFQQEVHERTTKSQVEDIAVPQGMYLVMKQSEMMAGMKTIGFAPCVALGLTLEGTELAYALAHLDGSTRVDETIDAMISELLMASGTQEGARISACIMGGAVAGSTIDTNGDLSGLTLFSQVKEKLYGIDAVTSIDEMQSQDSEGRNARIGGAQSEPGWPEGMMFFEQTKRDKNQLEPQFLAKYPNQLVALKQSLHSRKASSNESRDSNGYNPDVHMNKVLEAIEEAEKIVDSQK